MYFQRILRANTAVNTRTLPSFFSFVESIFLMTRSLSLVFHRDRRKGETPLDVSMPLNATIQIFASQISHPPFVLHPSVRLPVTFSRSRCPRTNILMCMSTYIHTFTLLEHNFVCNTLYAPSVLSRKVYCIYHYQWSYFAWKPNTRCQVSQPKLQKNSLFDPVNLAFIRRLKRFAITAAIAPRSERGAWKKVSYQVNISRNCKSSKAEYFYLDFFSF